MFVASALKTRLMLGVSSLGRLLMLRWDIYLSLTDTSCCYVSLAKDDVSQRLKFIPNVSQFFVVLNKRKNKRKNIS